MVVADPAGHGMISRVTADLQTEASGLAIEACIAQHQGDRAPLRVRVAA
jgi:hypothetical protein